MAENNPSFLDFDQEELIKKVASATAEEVSKALNKQEDKEGQEESHPETVADASAPKEEKQTAFFSSFHGIATDRIPMSMKGAEMVIGNKGNELLVKKGDLKLQMPDGYSLGLNEHKLLWRAIQAFTSINTHGKDPSNLVVTFSLDDFASLTGKDISTRNKRKDFSKKIKGYLESLKYINVGIMPQKKDDKKKYKYSEDLDDCMIFQRVAKSNGQIAMKFTEDYGSYLTHRPLAYYSPTIYKLENQNDFQLALNLNAHFSMDSNIGHGTFNRLKVSTILTYIDLPSIEELRKKKQGWDNNIKTPLENMLNRLTKEGFLCNDEEHQWHYVRKNGAKIPDKDFSDGTISTYDDWTDLLIEYWIADYPMGEQIPRIAENIQKKQDAKDRSIKNNVKKGIEKEKAYAEEMARLEFEARQAELKTNSENVDAE